MAFLLLDTHSSDENFNGDCDLGIVEITPDLQETIKNGQGAFRALSKQCATLDQIMLREPPCIFLSYTDADGLFDEADLPEPGRYRILSRSLPNLNTIQGTDCNRLVLDKHDVWWNAIVRHCSTQITTTCISIKDLLKLSITG